MAHEMIRIALAHEAEKVSLTDGETTGATLPQTA
jgi:hypothetical protein